MLEITYKKLLYFTANVFSAEYLLGTPRSNWNLEMLGFNLVNEESGKSEYREKNLSGRRARTRANNKLNLHMTRSTLVGGKSSHLVNLAECSKIYTQCFFQF